MNSSLSYSQIATPETPWLGLRSFTEDAHDYFFGRQSELEDLFGRIVDKPLTIFFGQSGLGKSSLIQAALIPTLRRHGFLPVRIRIDHEPNAPAPEEQILSELQNSLYGDGFATQADIICEGLAAPAFDAASFLWLLFHDPAFGFLPGAASPAPRPVFLIDQFEEIFTLGERPMRRSVSHGFREALAALVENRPPSALRARLESDDELSERINYRARTARVLLSLREDFLHVLERWRRFMPSLMENRLELRMLSGTQALEAVVRPGQLRDGLPAIVPDEVGHAIVRFVAGAEPDVPLAEIDAVPPLLSLVCAELNSQRLAAGETQVSRAQFEGHSDEILQSFYRRSFDPASYGGAFAEVPDAGFALQALQRLIEEKLLSPDGFRESIAFDTIARELSRTVPADTARHLLTEIVERRLLTVEERGGVRRLELAHDVLAPIVKKSRDERQEKEAVELARVRQEQAEKRTRKAEAEKNRLRRLAIVAVACAVIAAVGAGFGIVGMIRARHAAAEAARGFGAARAATDGFLARIAGQDLAYVPGIQELREEMADKAISQYQAMLEGHEEDEDLRLALAKAHKARAEILAQIGSVQEARTALIDSVKELSRMLARHETQEMRLLLAEAQLSLSHFQYDIGDTQPGIESANASLAAAAPVLKEGKHAKAAGISARSYNLLGNLEEDRLVKIRWFEQGRKIALENQEAAADDAADAVNLTLGLSSTTWNLRRQTLLGENAADKTQGEKLREEALKADEKLRRLQPNSPAQQRNTAISHTWLGEEQEKKGRTVEARQHYEEALKLCRAASENNPGVVKYHGDLILTLKDYGLFLTRLGDKLAAQAAYQEALGLAGKVVGIRAERPRDGERLLWVYYNLANFQQNTSTAAAEKTRAEGIETGRGLVRRHPDYPDLCRAFEELLGFQATFEPVLSTPPKAAELLREALSLVEQRKARLSGAPSPGDAANYLKWSEGLDNALAGLPDDPATKAAVSEERARLLKKALEWRGWTQDNDARQNLLSLASRHAKILFEAGQAAKAAELHREMIAYAEPTLAAKPFDWYLRDAISGQYKGLARACEKMGALEEEFAARRKAIETSYKRNFGVGIFDEVLKPDAKPTPELMQRLRTVDEWVPSMKRFTIPCNFSGITSGFHVYIFGGVPAPDSDPLADQAQWLKEIRGGTVPEPVRDSFRRLARIATENKVDFAELCVYALGTASATNADASAAARLAIAKTDAGIKTGLAKAVPGDVAKQKDAAVSLVTLGDAYRDAKIPGKAEEIYLEALAMREKMLAADTVSTTARRGLADAHRKLAELYASTEKREKMFGHYAFELKLRQELAEQSPKDATALASLAELFESLRTEYRKSKDSMLEQALKTGLAAIKAREAHLALSPGDAERRRFLANDLNVQGMTLCRDGWRGMAEAPAFFDRSDKLYAELKAKGKLDAKQLQTAGIMSAWSRQASEVIAAKQALDSKDPNTAARLGKAILQLASGTAEVSAEIVNEGFDLLQSLPDGRPDTVEVQNLLLKKMRETGRDEDALRPLAKLLQTDPANLGALDEQADIHFKAKRFAEAAQSYQKILVLMRGKAEASPSTPLIKETLRAWKNLGTSLMISATPAAAEAPLTDALAWCMDAKRKEVLGGASAENEEIACRKKLVALYFSYLKEPGKALPHQKAVSSILDGQLKLAQNFTSNVSADAAEGFSSLAMLQASSGEHKEETTSRSSELALRRNLFTSAPSTALFEQYVETAGALVRSASKAEQNEDALKHGREAMAFCEGVKAGQVPPGVLRSGKIALRNRLASVLDTMQRYEDSAVETQNVLNLAREEYESHVEGSPDRKAAKDGLVSALGNHSWYLLLARKFDQVLKTAKESFALEPKIWVETNLAHALLFSGHLDEALAIYRKNRGKKLEINNAQPWEEAVRGDFAQFRKASLDHGDFAIVERELGLKDDAPIPKK